MKKIFVVIFLALGINISSQSKIICEYKDPNVLNVLSLDLTSSLKMKDHSLDDQLFETLIVYSGSSDNFETIRCQSNCSGLGSLAILDDSMRRILYLENELGFFRSVDSMRNNKQFDLVRHDSIRLSKQFELAHQLGHHICKHSSLRDPRFRKARDVCDTRSKMYNKEECKSKSTYKHYRRLYELQADRYAGYYLARLFSLQDIELYIIEASRNGPRFYPNIAERLEAIRQGYSLSQEDQKYKRILDSDKILNYLIYKNAIKINSDRDPELNSHCDDIIVSQSRYAKVKESSIEILEMEVEDNCLRLKLKFKGCQESEIDLIDAGVIKESYPPQRSLKIEFINEDSCHEVVTKDFYFNLSKSPSDNFNGIIVFNLGAENFKVEY